MSLHLDVICAAVQLVARAAAVCISSYTQKMQGTVTLIPPIITHVMHQVLRVVRTSLRMYWNLSINCVPLHCSVRCTQVSPCYLKNIFETYKHWPFAPPKIGLVPLWALYFGRNGPFRRFEVPISKHGSLKNLSVFSKWAPTFLH